MRSILFVITGLLMTACSQVPGHQWPLVPPDEPERVFDHPLDKVEDRVLGNLVRRYEMNIVFTIDEHSAEGIKLMTPPEPIMSMILEFPDQKQTPYADPFGVLGGPSLYFDTEKLIGASIVGSSAWLKFTFKQLKDRTLSFLLNSTDGGPPVMMKHSLLTADGPGPYSLELRFGDSDTSAPVDLEGMPIFDTFAAGDVPFTLTRLDQGAPAEELRGTAVLVVTNRMYYYVPYYGYFPYNEQPLLE